MASSTIHEFHVFMRVVFDMCADGKEHTLREAIEVVCKHFRYSSASRKKMLPSGRQPIIDNRVGWARFYLAKAGLLEATGHGVFRITDRGKMELKIAPKQMDVKYLEKYPEFVKFRSPAKRTASPKARGIKVRGGISIEVNEGVATITLDANLLPGVIRSIDPSLWDR